MRYSCLEHTLRKVRHPYDAPFALTLCIIVATTPLATSLSSVSLYLAPHNITAGSEYTCVRAPHVLVCAPVGDAMRS